MPAFAGPAEVKHAKDITAKGGLGPTPTLSRELSSRHCWPKLGYGVSRQPFCVERVSGQNLFQDFAIFRCCYDHTSSARHLWTRCNKVTSSIIFFEKFYMSVDLRFDFFK